jgi:hypothetical protein
VLYVQNNFEIDPCYGLDKKKTNRWTIKNYIPLKYTKLFKNPSINNKIMDGLMDRHFKTLLGIKMTKNYLSFI